MNAYYEFANQAVIDSFVTGKSFDPAVQELVEGYGRDRDGIFQRMFTEEDADLD